MSTTESSSIRTRFSSMSAKIAELENEVNGVTDLDLARERNVKRIAALEASVTRLRSLLQDARTVVDEYLRADNIGGIEEADVSDPRPYRRSSLAQFLARVLQICGSGIPETDDEDEDNRHSDIDHDHRGDDRPGGAFGSLIKLGSGNDIFGTDGDDQIGTSQVSQVATQVEAKKTFFRWLEDDKTASDHKRKVIKLGTKLSLMVVDFLFWASKGNILEIVGTFRTALEEKSRFADKKSCLVVVEIFLELLDFGEEEARKLERIESESSSGLIIKPESAAGIVDMFIEEILNLEAFVNKMLMSREAIADAMRLGLEECRAQLEDVGAQVSQQRLLLLSSFKEVPESVAVLRKKMEYKARRLWGRFGS